MKLLLFLIPQSHEDFDLLFGLEDSIELILNDLVIYLMLFFSVPVIEKKEEERTTWIREKKNARKSL
jgi:hypothetical protein